MSVRSDVLLWAQRIVNKKTDSSPTHLLEIREAANLEEAQQAFHKIARMAHPDLHRTSLSADELELVTRAYGRAANAYQEFRTQRMQSTRLPTRTTRPTSDPKAGDAAAGQMTPKALVYFRKAEMALRRGDLQGGVLQLKMAIAADPLSKHLRAALAKVQSEIAKGG